jgi:hypothetical protein
MRFQVGERYELANGGRTAVVIQVHSDGRAGLLRFADTVLEEWVICTELHQEGRWRKKQT